MTTEQMTCGAMFQCPPAVLCVSGHARCGTPIELVEGCVWWVETKARVLVADYHRCNHSDDVHLPGGGCSECSPFDDWEHDFTPGYRHVDPDGLCTHIANGREENGPCGHGREYHYGADTSNPSCDGCANDGRGGNFDSFTAPTVERDHEATTEVIHA